MRRKGIALSVSLIAVLSMLVLPNSFSTEAAPAPCGAIRFFIDYIDPATGNPVTLMDDSNTKFGVPVETDLTFTVVPNPAMAGKAVKFNSPNQFLQLIVPPLGADSISDTHTVKYNAYIPSPPPARQNVNFEITWPQGDTTSDGTLQFKARIHQDNLDNPATPALDHSLLKGRLLTIGTSVAGGRCGAHIEIYGTPNNPPPGPDICLGLNVKIYFQSTDGNFYPVVPVVQSPTNSQFSGPGVGYKVKYVITSPVPFGVLNPVNRLRETDTFNRQKINSATATGIVPVITNNVNPPNKVAFFPWTGQQKEIITTALTAGLDTVTFVSTNPKKGNAVVSLCSVHREVRIGATPLAPPAA